MTNDEDIGDDENSDDDDSDDGDDSDDNDDDDNDDNDDDSDEMTMTTTMMTITTTTKIIKEGTMTTDMIEKAKTKMTYKFKTDRFRTTNRIESNIVTMMTITTMTTK